MTPIEYCRTVRITRAREVLEGGQTSQKEIAESPGYNGRLFYPRISQGRWLGARRLSQEVWRQGHLASRFRGARWLTSEAALIRARLLSGLNERRPAARFRAICGRVRTAAKTRRPMARWRPPWGFSD